MSKWAIAVAAVLLIAGYFYIDQTIVIREADGVEETHSTRHIINNCGGTGLVTRQIEQSGSLGVGAERGLEFGLELLKTQISRQYDVTTSSTQSISIDVPPGKNMDVTLKWRTMKYVGRVAMLPALNILSAEYSVFLPRDVEIGSQVDVGCSGGPNEFECGGLIAHASALSDAGDEVSHLQPGECAWITIDWCGYDNVSIEDTSFYDQARHSGDATMRQLSSLRVCPTFSTDYTVRFNSSRGERTMRTVRIEIPNVVVPPITPSPTTTSSATPRPDDTPTAVPTTPTPSPTSTKTASPTPTKPTITVVHESFDVQVDASAGWVNTSIYVGPGDQISIKASGEWTIDTNRMGITPFVGPSGYGRDLFSSLYDDPSEETLRSCVMDRNLNIGMLLTRVGDGPVIPLGDDANVEPSDSESGYLSFSINDSGGCLGDNSGSVAVAIEVIRPVDHSGETGYP